MYLLGIDIGTSSIKVSVVEAQTQKCVASAQFPEEEAPIISIYQGYAEQNPLDWWYNVQLAILKCHASNAYNPKEIEAIGIAYQMHGLVIVDQLQNVLRNSIIWCDSRAVKLGEDAFHALGSKYCLQNLLNSPGNFTASKLAWVKQNEPEIYERIYKFMLPGDFIAMKLTGEITTSISALSEGIFWDFESDEISATLMDYYGLDHNHVPEIRALFSQHGGLKEDIAQQLGLSNGIPVTYKAGDQPNNALSLNVLKPGEVAATAGTSGVIYAISDQLTYDPHSRINTFANIDYTPQEKRTGVLLCINGAGSLYRWARNTFAPQLSYPDLNQISAQSPIGSKGLKVLPFGNGAERMLNNRYTGMQLADVDLNVHTQNDIFRAVQESIGFSFRYGFDIMRENGIKPNIIRAGHSNLFLSDVFTQSFVDVTGTSVEIYESDGSIGAAIGAGIGAKIYSNADDAFSRQKPKRIIHPANEDTYEEFYQGWKRHLNHTLDN